MDTWPHKLAQESMSVNVRASNRPPPAQATGPDPARSDGPTGPAGPTGPTWRYAIDE
ncbi:hypothetical protein R8Z50_25205 [Longispora sp. K20-0274]|uniref:hypothetical protein n=1 Tax=Longispora sp. K20-0274 TaxID=3088255 RepID=UPI00399B0D8C